MIGVTMKKIQQEMSFDSLTPILVYRALGGIGSCILESAYEKGEGKVSMIGINPIGTFKAKGKEIEIELHGEKTKHVGDPYEALKQFSKDRKTFGFISYGAIRFKESIPDRHPSTDFPDFFFHLYETVIIFYHDKRKIVCFHEGNQSSLDALMNRCHSPVVLQPFKSPKKIDLQPDLSK